MSTRKLVVTTFLIGSLAIGLWLLWGLVGVQFVARWWLGSYSAPTVTDLGQIGDLFGGINALFAAFAFGGVGIAAYFQYQTWKLQVAQTDMAARQHAQDSFEPLFFELLRRVDKPESLNSGGVIGGNLRSNLAEVAVGLRDHLQGQRNFTEVMSDMGSVSLTDLRQLYERIYKPNEAELGPYFRALYHVFKLVWMSGFEDKQKVKYANIARSTLGSDEVLLLAMDGLTHYGDMFHALIEHFGLLKHFNRNRETKGRSIDQILIEDLYNDPARLSHAERLEHWKNNPEEREKLDAALKSL